MEEKKQAASPIKQRILEYLGTLSIKKREFHLQTGISRGTLESHTGITEEVLHRFMQQYPEVSPAWLIQGEGPVLRAEAQPVEVHPEPRKNFSRQGAPYYNVDFVGGFDFVENDQTIHPSYHIDFEPYNRSGVMWCNLTGCSMEPEICNGDIIAIKQMYTAVEYLPLGEIYAIVSDEYRTVKRIGRSEKPGHLRLIPSNPSPRYSVQDIPIEQIRKIYRVIGSMRRY